MSNKEYSLLRLEVASGMYVGRVRARPSRLRSQLARLMRTRKGFIKLPTEKYGEREVLAEDITGYLVAPYDGPVD